MTVNLNNAIEHTLDEFYYHHDGVKMTRIIFICSLITLMLGCVSSLFARTNRPDGLLGVKFGSAPPAYFVVVEDLVYDNKLYTNPKASGNTFYGMTIKSAEYVFCHNKLSIIHVNLGNISPYTVINQLSSKLNEKPKIVDGPSKKNTYQDYFFPGQSNFINFIVKDNDSWVILINWKFDNCHPE